jgi:uncharacterized protein (DUF1800 family)
MNAMRTVLLLAATATLVLDACVTTPRVAPLPTQAQVAARELTAEEQARHALDRVAFGPRPGDVNRVEALGVDRWIAQQLDPSGIRDDATTRIVASFPLARAAPADVLDDVRGAAPGDTVARRNARRRAADVARQVQTERLARAVGSERQLEEVLVDFWANHFSVFAGKGPVRLYIGQYERDAIRPFVLGRFRDMLGAVAHSPAMLYYLDNWRSAADSLHPTLARQRLRRPLGVATRPAAAAGRPRGLNENYARELLELHTLGVDGGYTQQDVIEVARAFTGWTIAAPREGGGFVFRPALHDAGAKLVLGVRIPAGGGESDGERVLDLLARHPSTARLIATKLVMRFVNDDPPPALVARAAAVFTSTDGDLRETLRAILTSPEFFSRAAFRSKVKSPFELVASGMRAVGASPDTTPRAARTVAQLGQPLYGHRDPNGWPEKSAEWLSAGAVVSRINFGLGLAARVPLGDSLRASLASPEFQRR